MARGQSADPEGVAVLVTRDAKHTRKMADDFDGERVLSSTCIFRLWDG